MQIKIKEKLYITGRGTVLVFSCSDNGIDTTKLTVNEAMKLLPQVDSEFEYDGKTWIVRGIEAFQTLMDPPRLSSSVGLLVREKL